MGVCRKRSTSLSDYRQTFLPTLVPLFDQKKVDIYDVVYKSKVWKSSSRLLVYLNTSGQNSWADKELSKFDLNLH